MKEEIVKRFKNGYSIQSTLVCGGLLYRHTVCKDGKALANCDTYADAVEYIERKMKEEK